MGFVNDQLVRKTEAAIGHLQLPDEELESDELFEKVQEYIINNNMLVDCPATIAAHYTKEIINAQGSRPGSSQQ